MQAEFIIEQERYQIINYRTLHYREKKFGQALNRKNIEMSESFDLRKAKIHRRWNAVFVMGVASPSHLKDTRKSKWEIAIGKM